MMDWFYRCHQCQAEYPMEPGRYVCGACAAGQRPGQPLEGVLECHWRDGDGPRAAESRAVRDSAGDLPLPVEAEWFPAIPVGGTPLWAPERLRATTGFPQLFLKDDTCNPSGSFKDRASLLVAAFARKHGLGEVALASTGNAASSMACVGAAAGLKVTVFLPEAAPVAKRIQVLQYGAALRPVKGSYDLAFEQSLAWTRETGVLSRNTAFNPLTIEGKKTVAFEICRDLARTADQDAPGAAAWLAPDHVFVPTGDGVILAGVCKGFEDLLRLGRIGRMPVVWACQAEGSSAIARALAGGGFGDPVASRTVADSISVDAPRNGIHALAKLRRHGGRAVVADDNAILAAQRRLSAESGLFAEPSSACAFAGFLKASPEIGRGERVVVMVTGSGLKDIRGAMAALGLEG